MHKIILSIFLALVMCMAWLAPANAVDSPNTYGRMVSDHITILDNTDYKYSVAPALSAWSTKHYYNNNLTYTYRTMNVWNKNHYCSKTNPCIALFQMNNEHYGRLTKGEFSKSWRVIILNSFGHSSDSKSAVAYRKRTMCMAIGYASGVDWRDPGSKSKSCMNTNSKYGTGVPVGDDYYVIAHFLYPLYVDHS